MIDIEYAIPIVIIVYIISRLVLRKIRPENKENHKNERDGEI
jgi:hypothetical protein